jgi:sugar transferase (PEP-CTERM/EpsH1 system associated)
MHIVWVKAGGLVPLTSGGRSRSYNILRQLAKRHAVSVFTYYEPDPEDTHSAIAEHFSYLESLPIKVPLKGSANEKWHYLQNVFSSEPYSLRKYAHAEVRERLSDFLRHHHCDAIICDFLFSAPVIPWNFDGTKLFFSHNVEARIWEQQLQKAKNSFWKGVCWYEAHRTARAERKYMRCADHVIAVSEVDRNVFSQFIDSGNISVIPTGVDVDYFSPNSGVPVPNTLVFTGSMDWRANQDGVLYFTREIFPAIQQRLPSASFWIVGRSPSREIRDLEQQFPNVHVTGTVPDVRPYIAKAAACVVPLRVGSGTRLKIFESMAMAKPVISTPLGAEGLPVVDGENILIAESHREFANAVVDLLDDPERQKRIGCAARQFVLNNHSVVAVGAKFEEIVLRAIESRIPSYQGR